MNKHQTTLYVEDELFQKFKRKCKSQGYTMSDVYTQLIADYVNNQDMDTVDTVTDTMTVDLSNNKEEKSWIRRKLNL